MVDEQVKGWALSMVESYVSHNKLEPDEVVKMLESLLATLSNDRPNSPVPAVPIEESVHDDYLICLEDGAKLKMLKRYLRNRFNMSASEYITKWGLPSDYPMVCKNYSDRRREVAIGQGLGQVPDREYPTQKDHLPG